MKSLSPREREVIQLRFGLTGDREGKTLDEVGRIFKLTKERVRQIESRALEKLKKPHRASKLASHI